MRNGVEDLKQEALKQGKQAAKNAVKQAFKAVGKAILSAILPVLPWIIIGLLIFIVIIACVDWDLGALAEENSITGEGDGWWWPIGSAETTTEGGKLFASGDPVSTTITSNFGDTEDRSAPHKGLDLAANGNIYIIASRSGNVETAGLDGSAGNWVVIDHGDGYKTKYMHMRELPKVKVGDEVEYGQVLGIMGSTGYSTGQHLHFQIEKNGVAVNPLDYISSADPRPMIIEEYSDTEMSIQEFLIQFGGNTTVTEIAGQKFYQVYNDSTADGYAVGFDVDVKGIINKGDKTAYVVDLKNGTPNKQKNAFQYALDKARAGIYIYIDQETCDSLCRSIVESKKSFMNGTQGKLGGYKFSTQQQYAIIALWYRGWDDTDFVNAWKEAKNKWEVNSWEFNKYVWEHALSKAGHSMESGGDSYAGYIKANDCIFNTYVKGIYKVSEGNCFSHNTLNYYTSNLVDKYWVATDPSSFGYTRDTSKDQQLFTMNTTRGKTGKVNDVSGNGYTKTYTSSNGKTFKLYQQWAGDYAGYTYWNGTISSSGCLITSTAIVVSGYKSGYEPDYFAKNQGGAGAGGEQRLIDNALNNKKKLNMNWKKASNKNEFESAIKSGKQGVFCMSKAINGDNGTYNYDNHYMSILDYKNGKVFIGDPGGRCESGWAPLKNVLNAWESGLYLDN